MFQILEIKVEVPPQTGGGAITTFWWGDVSDSTPP